MPKRNKVGEKPGLTSAQFSVLLFVRKTMPDTAAWLNADGRILKLDEPNTHFKLSRAGKSLKVPKPIWNSVMSYLISSKQRYVLWDVSTKGRRLMHEYIDAD